MAPRYSGELGSLGQWTKDLAQAYYGPPVNGAVGQRGWESFYHVSKIEAIAYVITGILEDT